MHFSIHQAYREAIYLFSRMLHFGSVLQRFHSADQCPALNSGEGRAGLLQKKRCSEMLSLTGNNIWSVLGLLFSTILEDTEN